LECVDAVQHALSVYEVDGETSLHDGAESNVKIGLRIFFINAAIDWAKKNVWKRGRRNSDGMKGIGLC
jgi:hypothetical protein